MMTAQKIRDAFASCRAFLPQNVSPVRGGDVEEHLVFMCEEGATYAEGRREKAMRWLGFVQGVLWMKGVEIDTLKHMNRPDGEPCFPCEGSGQFLGGATCDACKGTGRA